MRHTIMGLEFSNTSCLSLSHPHCNTIPFHCNSLYITILLDSLPFHLFSSPIDPKFAARLCPSHTNATRDVTPFPIFFLRTSRITSLKIGEAATPPYIQLKEGRHHACEAPHHKTRLICILTLPFFHPFFPALWL